jgi:hypothetical protein
MDHGEPLLRVKHSITVTDFTVHVWPVTARLKGEWCAIDRLPRLALTGLARKILRKSGIIPASTTAVQSSRNTGRKLGAR